MSGVGDSVCVADCQRVQTAWLIDQARALGGESWEDGGLLWAQQRDAAYLLFPAEIRPDALARGLERIRPANVIVGAWLSTEVDASPLADAGFDRGWSPWWMTAPIQAVGSSQDDRVELKEDSSDYTGEHASYGDNLALARVRPKRTWYAAAYSGSDRRFAGQAWSHLVGELAGIFDMAVWPPFRRRGLGTALLQAVSAAAGNAGAKHAVLNATPDGKKLYETCGFTQIGEGITWWLHPPD
jgi:GNAT superfamily N-acetyltransferase